MTETAQELVARLTGAATYHSRIMNLPCGGPDLSGLGKRTAHKMGHREARHAAAEIALDADTAVVELLAWQAAALARETAAAEREARLREALEKIAQGWVDEADPDTGISLQVNMSMEEAEDIARTALGEQP